MGMHEILLEELQGLQKERQKAKATMDQIDGAERMVLHLIGKLHDQAPQRNGNPVEGQPVRD